MGNDIAGLQAEIERLNAIIDVLLSENKHLRSALSLQSTDDGNLHNDHSLQFTQDGKPQSNTSYLSTQGGNMGHQPSNLSIKEGNMNINTSLLERHLRKEMLQSRDIGVKNAAKLLLHFYHHPQNTHKSLTALAGITMSGIAKHIHMLKKRELIIRNGFQTYALTPKALGILEKASQ